MPSVFVPRKCFLLGPGHTVAHHSAVLRILALDQDLDPDQDPGLTPFLQVGHVHVPMADPIHAPLTLDETDAVMDAHGQGHAPAQGLLATGGLVRHVLPFESGKELKGLDPTGHGPVPLVAFEAAALVGGGCPLESYFLMTSKGTAPLATIVGKESGTDNGRRSTQTGTTNTTKTMTPSIHPCITGATAAERARGRKCPHPEITHLRGGDEEDETREGVLLIIYPHHLLQGTSPALNS